MAVKSISPKLVVDDAQRALSFYCDVLGGEVAARFEHQGAVVFAEVRVGDSAVVQVKDADAIDRSGSGVIVDVLCDDPDAVMARALSSGAQEVFPVADQPYGARQGRFRDPFGHQWIVGTEVTMTPEEIQAVLEEDTR
jgi:PhnB protein